MQSETARRGREGVSAGIRCVQITVCMVCSHHPNHTPAPSQLHADGTRIGREGEEKEGEERVAAHSFPPTSRWHTPQPLIFPPFLPSPSSSLSLHPPPIHTLSSPLTWLTTTSTSLLLSLTHPNPHPMHVPVHKETQQQQQQPHHSRSSPPAAHVLLHLHATHAHTSSKWYMCE